MWDSSQSDVARISQALERNASGQEGDKLYQKFNGTTQEPVRLAVALRGFFLADGVTESQREVFGAYLKRRIRPTAEALIEAEALPQLQQLEALGWLDAALVDAFLQSAIRQRKTSVTVWLLQLKTQKYGFRDRDFTL